MKIVLDTNVFVSGVFFGGPPGRILEGWRDSELEVVIVSGDRDLLEVSRYQEVTVIRPRLFVETVLETTGE